LRPDNNKPSTNFIDKKSSSNWIINILLFNILIALPGVIILSYKTLIDTNSIYNWIFFGAIAFAVFSIQMIRKKKIEWPLFIFFNLSNGTSVVFLLLLINLFGSVKQQSMCYAITSYKTAGYEELLVELDGNILENKESARTFDSGDFIGTGTPLEVCYQVAEGIFGWKYIKDKKLLFKQPTK